MNTTGLKLKVCGLKEPANVKEISSLGIDYAGFIFYPESPRYVEPEALTDLIELLPADVKATGVFVSEDIVQVILKARKYKLSALQLHGDETPEDCERLRELGYEVIKVFSIGDKFKFKKLDDYADYVDYFLFDTKGKYRGGNGITFNWKLLNKYKGKTPFFLSGGVSLDQLEQLDHFEWKTIYGVDVNSKFEINPGHKDVRLVKQLVKKIKGD